MPAVHSIIIKFLSMPHPDNTIDFHFTDGPYYSFIAKDPFSGPRPPGWFTTLSNTVTYNRLQTTVDNFVSAVQADCPDLLISRLYYDTVIISNKELKQIESYASTTNEVEIKEVNGDNWPYLSIVKTVPPLVPVYNPVVYSFFSDRYFLPGYRYVITLDKISSEFGLYSEIEFAKYKVAPDQNGIGYIDISKALSNFTTVNFNPMSVYTPEARNSSIQYNISIEEEYAYDWQPYQVSSSSGKLMFTGDVSEFIEGDQITITSYDTEINAMFGGLFTVQAGSDSSNIIVNRVYTGPVNGVGGLISVVYSDGRKVPSERIANTGAIAFNGARSFEDFIDYDYQKYDINTLEPIHLFLSSLRNSDAFIPTPTENRYWMTPSQKIWLNYKLTGEGFVNPPEYGYDLTLSWDVLLNNIVFYAGTPVLLNVTQSLDELKQVEISWDLYTNTVFGQANPIQQGCELKFRLEYVGPTKEALTEFYSIYADCRCKIEDYEIYYMDRMGSILSFAFPLRAKETNTVTREMSKQAIDYYDLPNAYIGGKLKTYLRGTNINSVNLTQDIELNTNWMNTEMSKHFDELITSPYTWIRKRRVFTDGSSGMYWYACTVNETSFETQKQKNKVLIKKTVTVKYANENIINC